MSSAGLLISRKLGHPNTDTGTHIFIFKIASFERRYEENKYARVRIALFGLANDRKVTDKELVRAIHFMVAAEYEAIQLYMPLAESTDNKLAVELLKDIADEECVHAGEFPRLLRKLAPDEEKFHARGEKEVEAEIKKMK